MPESPWIWMKGSGVTLEDPISLREGDDRPSAKELIASHREKIDQLRKELKHEEHYDGAKHDDLWLVRFLLSHKNKHKAALKAAKHTLEFRAEHKLDDVDIRQYPIGPEGLMKSEGFKRYMKYCPSDMFVFTLPDPQRGVVAYLTLDGGNDQQLVDKISEEDWIQSFLYAAEWSHQWLDYITRTTGRLTKSIRLVDVTGASIMTHNREKTRRDGEATALMEDCYPQMLQSIFVCNPPPWVQIIWRVVRVIMPKRAVEKIDFVSPSKSKKELERLLKWIDEDKLPVKFGGKYQKWPPKITLPST